MQAGEGLEELQKTLDAAMAESEGLAQDLEELERLVGGEPGNAKSAESLGLRGGSQEDEAGEKAVDDGESLSLKPTAEEDSLSSDLFLELTTLNAELEAMGVKAFGDLEESAYRSSLRSSTPDVMSSLVVPAPCGR